MLVHYTIIVGELPVERYLSMPRVAPSLKYYIQYSGTDPAHYNCHNSSLPWCKIITIDEMVMPAPGLHLQMS